MKNGRLINQAPGNTAKSRHSPREWSQHHLTAANRCFPAPFIDHWVLQLHGVAPATIDNTESLLERTNALIGQLSLTKVSEHAHYFDPGVSVVLILSESHLSVHTWPELGYVHVDIVTCAEHLTREALDVAFQDKFQPEFIKIDRLKYD